MAEDYVNFDMETGDRVNDISLAKQSLETLDPEKITADTHEVISRQATMNIGTIGHVAHGKSTIVKTITGVQTTRFDKEARRNSTIHLGYANAKIFRAPSLPEPECYVSLRSNAPDDSRHPVTNEPMKLIRHVSFVDCPGHDVLMATMLNGAAVMDAALLLIAANELFPQPQTLEHLRAVEIMKLKHILIIQNKIDLVTEAAANEQKTNISKHFTNTINLNCPIIPISAQLNVNIDRVLEYICHIPFPPRMYNCPCLMRIIRSFDINRKGDIDNLKGGVAGGTVLKGILKRGAIVEVLPGILGKRENGMSTYRPLETEIRTIDSESIPLKYAVPGGLIGAGTSLDPSLTRLNKLVGQIIRDKGSMKASVFQRVAIDYVLMPSVTDKDAKSVPISLGSELFKINIGSMSISAQVVQTVKDPRPRAELVLGLPCCCAIGDIVTLSKKFEGIDNFRLIGWGRIIFGIDAERESDIVEPVREREKPNEEEEEEEESNNNNDEPESK